MAFVFCPYPNCRRQHAPFGGQLHVFDPQRQHEPYSEQYSARWEHSLKPCCELSQSPLSTQAALRGYEKSERVTIVICHVLLLATCWSYIRNIGEWCKIWEEHGLVSATFVLFILRLILIDILVLGVYRSSFWAIWDGITGRTRLVHRRTMA
jgi:hypothetical protein